LASKKRSKNFLKLIKEKNTNKEKIVKNLTTQIIKKFKTIIEFD
jgi:hypothetical protein